MKINENFLENNNFIKLQELIFDLDFPWRIRNGTTHKDNNYYFTHSFFDKHKINSEYFDYYISPIIEKLKVKSLIQVRANMFLSKLFDKSSFHIDQNYKCKTSILYLNSCNGGTEFKKNNNIEFIKAEENKLITFNNVEHRAVTSTDCSIRFILNFNYF